MSHNINTSKEWKDKEEDILKEIATLKFEQNPEIRKRWQNLQIDHHYECTRGKFGIGLLLKPGVIPNLADSDNDEDENRFGTIMDDILIDINTRFPLHENEKTNENIEDEDETEEEDDDSADEDSEEENQSDENSDEKSEDEEDGDTPQTGAANVNKPKRRDEDKREGKENKPQQKKKVNTETNNTKEEKKSAKTRLQSVKDNKSSKGK